MTREAEALRGGAATLRRKGALTPELGSEPQTVRHDAAARLLRHLLRPYWLVVAPLMLSFIAWIIPWSSHVEHGYSVREPLTVRAAIVLTLWYGLAIATAFAGYMVGRRTRPLRSLNDFPAGRYYAWLTFIAAAGVLGAYGKIFIRDPHLLLRSLREENFNQVRYALDYGAGIQTLRYAASLSGGIAIYNLFIARRFRWIHVLNFIALFAAAALASRLSVILAVMVALSLYAWGAPSRRDSLKGAAIVAIVAFLALVMFNYIRNGGYYRVFYGVRDPFTANLYQSLSYLGGPFQVSVAVARRSKLPPRYSDLVLDGDVEQGTTYWLPWQGSLPPSPAVSVTHDPRYVVKGRSALLVQASNPTSKKVAKYVFAALSPDRAPTGNIGASPGEHLLLQAFVAGSASPKSPIRLGIRIAAGVNAGAITQEDVKPIGSGLTKTWAGKPDLLGGIVTVPSGVTDVQPAIWKEIPPGGRAMFAVDDVGLYPVDVSGGRIRLIRPSLAAGIARYLVPTYAPGDFTNVLRVEDNYRHFTDVQTNLNTNSIYGMMRLSIGNWAFLLMAFVAFIAAALAGHASLYRSYFLLATVVVSYCFAEYWRAYLFNVGIIHFLFLSLLLIPLADALLRRLRRRVR